MNNTLIIETSNFILTGTTIYAVWMVLRWKIHDRLSPETIALVNAWLWIFLSVGITAAWFAISRHSAEPGEIWNGAMFQNRVFLVPIAMLMFAHGMFSFIRHIEKIPWKRDFFIFGFIVSVSLFLGLM